MSPKWENKKWSELTRSFKEAFFVPGANQKSKVSFWLNKKIIMERNPGGDPKYLEEYTTFAPLNIITKIINFCYRKLRDCKRTSNQSPYLHTWICASSEGKLQAHYTKVVEALAEGLLQGLSHIWHCSTWGYFITSMAGFSIDSSSYLLAQRRWGSQREQEVLPSTRCVWLSVL